MRRDPLDEALAALERDRRGRTAAVLVVVLALVATVAIVAIADTSDRVTASGAAVVALLVVVAAHLASVLVRERRSEEATRALLRVREERASREARERALATLQHVTRWIGATLELRHVVDRAVEAAADLVGVRDAELLLRAGSELAVAAAVGDDPAPRGTRRAVTGADRSALVGGETVIGGRGDSSDPGPATITAPLELPGRVVGTLVVRGSAEGRPFGEADRLAVALLAQHVALALRNAATHDRERQRSEGLRGLVGVAPDAVDTDAARRVGW